MRIAITTLTTPAQPLGVGRYLIALIGALQEIDRENEYLVYTSQDNHHLFDLWADNFCEVRTIFHHEPRWVMRPLYYLWQNSWFLWQLRRRQVDLLHLPNLLPLFSRVIPSIVTIHDLGEFKTEKKYHPLRLWYRKSVLPITINNATRVVTVSQNTRTDLVSILGIAEDKIDITYEGVASVFTDAVAGYDYNAAAAKYSSQPFILYAGAMYPHKNLSRLLRAFARFKHSCDLPHKLVLAGRPIGQFNELVEQVHQLALQNDVVFTGYIPDLELVALYKSAALVTYVPLNEGFGLPILEAMATNTPLVASNVSSIPEVAGSAAFLVDPYDVEAIADAILQVLTNEQLRAGMVAKGRVQLEKFSWETCARKTLDAYKRAVYNGNITN